MRKPEAGPQRLFAVRSLAADDGPALARFAADVPEGERRFLKENLEDLEINFAAAVNDRGVRRLVAADPDGEIAGVAGAFPGSGWSSHVAEVRVIVSANHRRRGVGRALAGAALIEALALDCSRAYVEVVAEQEALVAMFQDLGFEPEALLADFVRDGSGEFHDLMLLTHHADEQLGRQQVLGLAEAMAP